MTSDEFEKYLEYNTGYFNFSCTDGEIENSYDFTSINGDLINNFFPEQMQEIPGYFNYNGMNTSGRQNANIQTKKPEADEKWKNEQILYQEEIRGTGILKKEAYEEGGDIPRVLDITDVVKNTYKKRIDCEFNCEAGKSLEEIRALRKSQEQSRWEGNGADFNPDERKLWNKRYFKEDYMLLSDFFHYPKLNSEGKITIPNDGDKIELNTICQSDVFVSKYIFPKPIDEKNDTVIVKIHEQSSSITMKLEHRESITFEEYCNKIETIINSTLKENGIKCAWQCLKNERWIISFENTFSFSLSGNAIDYLGGNNKEYYSTSNRIISVTSSLEGYTPLNLIKGDKETCEPIENDGWKTESFNDNPQNFIIDLLQTPYENSRRDWRYRSGSKNCMNCYCPNENCITNLYYHPNRVTVGTWSAKKNLSMGNGQTTCPACGADLSNEEGVVSIESDGIKSYYYDDTFNDYPFIKKIIFSSIDDKLFKCDYNVYYQNPDSGIWIVVFNATYDEKTGFYKYWYNNICAEYESTQNNITLTIKENGFRARYLKVETKNKRKRIMYNGVCEIKENKIIIDDYTDIDVDSLIGKVIRFSEEEIEDWEIESENENDIRIISNYIQDNKLVIKIDSNLESSIKIFKFYTNKYYGGIGKFQVYGIPFKNDEMTIVPPPDYEIGNISSNGLKLSQQPIQIMSVLVGSANGKMIYLSEIEDNEHSEDGEDDEIKEAVNNLFYEVEEKIYYNYKNNEEIKYYEIVSGEWYHEPKSNKILVPTKAKINGEILPLEYLTKNLEENGISLKEIEVNQVIVEYWSNSNKGVTLKASAAEMGPAYQLETEAICKIKNPEKLPSCGKSVKLFTSNEPNKTEKKDIQWFCYNHIQSTMNESNQTLLGGYFKKPNFYGTELGTLSGNTAKKFKELFGDHCTKISPRCFTEVTFYGKPNTILSGNIVAYAPKENKITYTFPNSENLTITEQTGGLEDGMFILEIKKGNADDKGRKTKTWDRPLIVVYAEDQEPFSGK